MDAHIHCSVYKDKRNGMPSSKNLCALKKTCLWYVVKVVIAPEE